MTNTLKTLLLGAVIAASFAPAAEAARLKRDDAVKICSSRIKDEMGNGTIKVLRSKRKSGGFKVRLMKLKDGSRQTEAMVECLVDKDKQLVNFDVKKRNS